MIVTALLAAGAFAAPAPPVPPPPPAPPAALVAPVPPAPPAPPVGVDIWGGGRQTVVTRNVDGHRVTVIARAPGTSPTPVVQSYRDPQGRDVQVYSDHAVSREEADRLLRDAQVEGERARAEGARAREQGRMAREAGERARVDGERIRREAMESARRAVEEAGLSSRDVADLRPMRELRIYRDGPPPTVDGRPGGPGYAERPEVRALRDEVRALREELKSMRHDLDRERSRR